MSTKYPSAATSTASATPSRFSTATRLAFIVRANVMHALPRPAAEVSRIIPHMRRLLLAALAFVFALGIAVATSAADERRVWVKSVPDETIWSHYSRQLNADEFGKFVIDVKSNEIYFIDVNL